MKRNSKRFMALFLSLAMSITPAILIQAEEAADIKNSSASDQDVLSEAELIPTVTASPTEAPSEDTLKTVSYTHLVTVFSDSVWHMESTWISLDTKFPKK